MYILPGFLELQCRNMSWCCEIHVEITYWLPLGRDCHRMLIRPKVHCHLRKNTLWKAKCLFHPWLSLNEKIKHSVDLFQGPVHMNSPARLLHAHDLTQYDATKDDESTKSKENVVDVVNVKLNTRMVAEGHVGYICERWIFQALPIQLSAQPRIPWSLSLVSAWSQPK